MTNKIVTGALWSFSSRLLQTPIPTFGMEVRLGRAAFYLSVLEDWAADHGVDLESYEVDWNPKKQQDTSNALVSFLSYLATTELEYKYDCLKEKLEVWAKANGLALSEADGSGWKTP